jgi:hypothetical protein
MLFERYACRRTCCWRGSAGAKFGLSGLSAGLFAMSPKAYKPSQLKSEDHQAAAPSSLLTLPDAVVAQIAQCSKQQSGHPFLRLSRGCRDAVLHSCSTIRLTVSSDSTVLAATARLLHRACTSAAPGVCLRLDLTTQSHALPQLLQPGIEAGGWANVHKLEVSAVSWGSQKP